MIMTNKDLLSEIKEVLNIETIFDCEDKTLEYQVKCITHDGELNKEQTNELREVVREAMIRDYSTWGYEI